MQRKAKVTFNFSGGTDSKGSVTNRITIPTSWVKEMGIEKGDYVDLFFDKENKIIKIEKSTAYSLRICCALYR